MSETPQRVSCPACKAPAGVPCRAIESGKQRIVFHLDRWRVFNAMRNREMVLARERNLPGMEGNATGESRKAPKSGFSERGF